jgi:hypothetical protein
MYLMRLNLSKRQIAYAPRLHEDNVLHMTEELARVS